MDVYRSLSHFLCFIFGFSFFGHQSGGVGHLSSIWYRQAEMYSRGPRAAAAHTAAFEERVENFGEVIKEDELG